MSVHRDTSHLNIEINQELHTQLKMAALKQKRRIGEVAAEAIQAYLAARAA